MVLLIKQHEKSGWSEISDHPFLYAVEQDRTFALAVQNCRLWRTLKNRQKCKFKVSGYYFPPVLN